MSSGDYLCHTRKGSEEGGIHDWGHLACLGHESPQNAAVCQEGGQFSFSTLYIYLLAYLFCMRFVHACSCPYVL